VIYDYEDVFYGQKQTLRSETDMFCYVGGQLADRLSFDSAGEGRLRAQACDLHAHARVGPRPQWQAGRLCVAPAIATGRATDAGGSAGTAAATADGNRVVVRVRSSQNQASLAGLIVKGSISRTLPVSSGSQPARRGCAPHDRERHEPVDASLLKAGDQAGRCDDLYRQTRDGKFGKLTLEVLLVARWVPRARSAIC